MHSSDKSHVFHCLQLTLPSVNTQYWSGFSRETKWWHIIRNWLQWLGRLRSPTAYHLQQGDPEIWLRASSLNPRPKNQRSCWHRLQSKGRRRPVFPVQQPEGNSPSLCFSCSNPSLNRLNDGHLHLGGHSASLPIQILILSRDTLTDTPRNV